MGVVGLLGGRIVREFARRGPSSSPTPQPECNGHRQIFKAMPIHLTCCAKRDKSGSGRGWTLAALLHPAHHGVVSDVAEETESKEVGR